MCFRIRRRRFGDGVFLPIDVLRNGDAGRLDDVDDVDANAGPDLADVRPEFRAYVAGNDGGHDDAVGATHVFEDPARMGFTLFDGVWIFRCLACGRSRSLCSWSNICGDCNAIKLA